MKADKETNICDNCKDTIANYKCYVCKKDLCFKCGLTPQKINYDSNLRINFVRKKDCNNPKICKKCILKIKSITIDSETIARFLRDNLITNKI